MSRAVNLAVEAQFDRAVRAILRTGEDLTVSITIDYAASGAVRPTGFVLRSVDSTGALAVFARIAN